MRELQEQRNLCRAKEEDLWFKEKALKEKDELQAILEQRKAAYLAAWRKAQLYADWRKEQFQAWSFTLDPDSSHSEVMFSHDKKSMTCNHVGVEKGYFVWGLEGIISGRCYWEVEVKNGDRSDWGLGIWSEDEETRYNAPSPSNGYWVVGRFREVFEAFTDPSTPINLRKFPQRVGVFLDYAQGDVSFYNMTDGSHIFSFPPESFSGTLLPFFTCYFGDVSMTLCPLEAGPQKPSVPMNNPPSLEEPVGPPGGGDPLRLWCGWGSPRA
ncbi:butyrophilin subfamily 3 member A3-like [Talpa occidentalis]|uniref:butyrophilin subfamily 3 member A3-like n=1 Tax=Talpa occidentalis TaxID=50954 RepID=UPI0023F877FB|nr:butyrophilin subfamily 3 member A3-like [Talpa occidentalis]